MVVKQLKSSVFGRPMFLLYLFFSVCSMSLTQEADDGREFAKENSQLNESISGFVNIDVENNTLTLFLGHGSSVSPVIDLYSLDGKLEFNVFHDGPLSEALSNEAKCSGLVRLGVCDLEFQWVTAELFALRNTECHIPKEIDFTRYIKTNSNDSNSAKVLIEGKDVHINSVMEPYLRNLSLNTGVLKIIEPLKGYNYMVQLNLERSNVSTGMCKPCLSFNYSEYKLLAMPTPSTTTTATSTTAQPLKSSEDPIHGRLHSSSSKCLERKSIGLYLSVLPQKYRFPETYRAAKESAVPLTAIPKVDEALRKRDSNKSITGFTRNTQNANVGTTTNEQQTFAATQLVQGAQRGHEYEVLADLNSNEEMQE